MRSAACRRGRRALGLASGDWCSSSPHHLIFGRTAGPHPNSACLRRGSHEDATHLQQRLCVWPKGGTVIIHPALTAATAAAL